MNDRFNQVLEDASKRVSEWPEWKKSEALKESERLLKSQLDVSTTGHEDSEHPKVAAAGSGQ